MTDYSWAFRPVQFRPNTMMEREILAEQEAARQNDFRSLPWHNNNAIGGLENPQIFMDETGRRVRGLMTGMEASKEAMDSSYAQGYLNQHKGFNHYVAKMIMGGRQFEDVDTTQAYPALQISEETKVFLNNTIGEGTWNNAFWRWDTAREFGSAVPIFGKLAYDTPADLFTQPAPEGWTSKEAFNALKEADPDLYWRFSSQFGGEKGLFEVVKDARNPAEFWYLLNHQQQMNAMAVSQKEFQKHAGALEEGAVFVGSFIRDGILNDPDMAASILVSLAAGALTGSTGAVAVWAAKAAKAGNRLSKSARVFNKIQYGTRTAMQYIPENIGPTLMKTHLFKNHASYGAWGKLGVNVLGNATEGSITGFLAEYANQRRLIDLGMQEEFDWGTVMKETAFEALLSPAINPIMGKAFELAGGTFGLAGAAVGKSLDSIKTTDFGKWFNERMTETVSLFNPEGVSFRIKGIENSQILEDRLQTILLQDADPEAFGDALSDSTLAGTLDIIRNQMQDMNDNEFMDMVITAVDSAIATSRGRHAVQYSEDGVIRMSPLELSLFVVNHLANKIDLDPQVKNNIAANIAAVENLKKEAKRRKAGGEPRSTIEDVFEDVRDNGMIYLGQDESVRERVIETLTEQDKSLDDLSIEQKNDLFEQTAKEMAEESVKKAEKAEKDLAKEVKGAQSQLNEPDINKPRRSVDESRQKNGNNPINITPEDSSASPVEQAIDVMAKIEEESAELRADLKEITTKLNEEKDLDQIEIDKLKKDQRDLNEVLLKLRFIQESLKNRIEKFAETTGHPAELLEVGQKLNDLNERRRKAVAPILPELNFIRATEDFAFNLDTIIGRLFEEDLGNNKTKADATQLTEDQRSLLENIETHIEKLHERHPERQGGKEFLSVLKALLGREKGTVTLSRWENAVKNLQSFQKTILNELRQDGRSKNKEFKELLVIEDEIKDLQREEQKLRDEAAFRNRRMNTIRLAQIGTVALARQSTRELRMVLDTRETVIEVLLQEKEQKAETENKNPEKIRVNIDEINHLLPPDSRLKRRLKKNKQKTMAIGKLRKELKEDFADLRKRKKIKKGKSARFTEIRKQNNGQKFVSDVSENDMLLQGADFSQADLAKMKKTTIERKEFIQGLNTSPEQQLDAWRQWKVNLLAATTSFKRDRPVHEDITIPWWVLAANMPQHFWDLELQGSLHIIFKDALETTEDSTNMPLHLMRFKLGDVLETTESWLAALLSKSEDVVKNIAERYAREVLKELAKENDPSQYANKKVALAFVTRVRSALTPFFTEMFNSEGRGYVVKSDPRTGHPIEYTKNKIKYRAAVRKGITRRVDILLNHNKYGRRLIGLHDRIENKTGSTQVEIITNHIIDNLDEINPYSPDSPQYIRFTLDGFGDGTLDWGKSPDRVGGAIVDTFIGKALPELSNLRTVEGSYNAQIMSETETEISEATVVSAPGEGDYNLAAPLGVWPIARALEDYRYRRMARRIIAITREAYENGGLTDSQREKIEKFFADKDNFDEPMPVDDTLGVFLAPQIVGGHLQEAPITLEQQIDFIEELLMDIPHISTALIQDSETLREGSEIAYRQDMPIMAAGPDLPGQFTPTIVPPSQMASLVAMDMMFPNLNGDYAERIISVGEEIVAKYREKWEKENPDKEWDHTILYDSSNTLDMDASIIGIIHTLALAADRSGATLRGIADLEKMVAGITEDDFTVSDNGDIIWSPRISDSKKNRLVTRLEDHYIKTGIVLFDLTKDIHPDNDVWRATGPWQGITTWLSDNDINTEEEYRNKINEWEQEGNTDSLRKAQAIREFLKIPIMRKLYGGGLPTWFVEFDLQTGKKKEVIMELQDAFGIKFTPENMEAFGKVLHRSALVGQANLLNTALGLSKEVKERVLNLLRIKPGEEAIKNHWEEVIASFNIPHSESKKSNLPQELNDKHPITLIELAEANLLAQIDSIAEREGITPAEVRKKYTRIEKAENYLNEIGQNAKDLNRESKEWEKLQEILHGNTQSWKTIGLFRALNTLNSSAFQANIERMNKVARVFNISNFDANDWLGLERLVVFHLKLPTQGSRRGYAGSNEDTNGIWNDRAVTDPKLFDKLLDDMESFPERNGGRHPNRSEFIGMLEDFLRADRSDSMGKWNLRDNIMSNRTREESRKLIKDMLLLQALLYTASKQNIPNEVLPGLGELQNTNKVYTDALMEMWDNTGERTKTFDEEVEWERAALEAGHSRALKARAQILGGVLDPPVSRMSGIPLKTFMSREFTAEEIAGRITGEEQQLILSTTDPTGILSKLPITKRVAFNDVGFPVLQQFSLQKQIDKIEQPLKNALGENVSEDADIMLPDHLLGRPGPYKKESLPKPEKTYPDEILDLFGRADDRVALKGLEIVSSLIKWSENRGISREELRGKGLVFWYLVKVTEEARKRNFIPSYRTMLTEDNEKEFMAQRMRIRWLQGIHAITYFSRDMKSRTRKGATISEKARRLALNTDTSYETWLTILVNSGDENSPYGQLLSSPTKLKPSLDILVPKEAALQAQEILNSGDELEWSELKEFAAIIQQTDLPFLLAKVYFRPVIGKAIRDYEVNGEKIYENMMVDKIDDDPTSENYLKAEVDSNGKVVQIPIWKDPNSYHKIPVEHRRDIVTKAKLSVREPDSGADSIIFDTLIVEQVAENGTDQMAIRMTPRAVTEEGTEIKTSGVTNVKSAFGPIFGAQATTSSTIKGTSGTLTMTPRAAMELLSFLENQPFLEAVRTQAIMGGKAVGTVKDPVTGKISARDPLATRIRRATAPFTQHGLNVAQLELSDALMRAAGIEVPTITNKSSEIMGANPTVIDLDLFVSSDINIYDSNLAPVWVESFISSLQEQITFLERTNLHLTVAVDESSQQVLTNLQDLVSETRKNPRGQNLATTIGLALLLDQFEKGKASPFISTEQIDVYFNRKLMSDKEIEKGIHNAKVIMRQLRRTQEAYRSGIDPNRRRMINLAREWFASLDDDSGVVDLVEGFTQHLQTLGIDAEDLGFEKTSRDVELSELTGIDILQSLGIDTDNIPDTNPSWLMDAENKIVGIDIETDLNEDNRKIYSIRLDSMDGKHRKTYRGIEEIDALFDRLEDLQNKGYILLTFNGLGFDFNELAKHATDKKKVLRIAGRHIDLHQVKSKIQKAGRGTLEVYAEKLGIPVKKDNILPNGIAVHLAEIKINEGRDVGPSDLQGITQDGKANTAIEYVNKHTATALIEAKKNYENEDVRLLLEIFKTLRKDNPRDLTQTFSQGVEGFGDMRGMLEENIGTTQSVTSLDFEEGDSALKFLVEHALGEHVQTLELEADIMARDDEDSPFGRSGKELLSSVSNPGSFAKSIENVPNNMDLKRLANTLNEMEIRREIDPKNARLYRALLARLHSLNPEILADLSFTADKHAKDAALRGADGQVQIRMGQRLTDVYSIDAPLTFAHELGHIGYMKFVEANPGLAQQWEDLHKSEVGAEYVRQLVTAWNNGQFNPEEFDYYMQNPQEFMAALVSYYLMNDSLPFIYGDRSDWADARREYQTKTDTLVQRILNFVRSIFERVASVWSNFHKSDPRIAQHVETLIQRSMGYDPRTGASMVAHKIEGKPSEMYMKTKYPQAEDAFNFDSFQKSVETYDTLVQKIEEEEGLTPNEWERFNEAETIISSPEANFNINFGLPRLEHARNLNKLKTEHPDLFSRSGDFDLQGFKNKRNSTSGDLLDASLVRSVAQMSLDAVQTKMGPAIQRGVGEAVSKAFDAASSTLSRGRNPKFLGNMMVELLTGKAGHNFTVNGPHQATYTLSQLIDSHIGTSLGQFNNTEGLTSLMDVLAEINLYSENIIDASNQIHKIVVGNLGSSVGYTSGKAEKLLIKINSEIAKKVENAAYNIELDADDKALLKGENGFEELTEHTTNVANTLRSLAGDFKQLGIKLGEISPGAEVSLVPWRLSKEGNLEDFRTSLYRIFKERLSTDDKNIDSLVALESNLIPRVDTLANLRTDLNRMRDEYGQDVWNLIATEVGGYFETETSKLTVADKRTKGNRQLENIVSDTVNPVEQQASLDLVRRGVLRVMRKMQQGVITWANLSSPALYNIPETTVTKIASTYQATVNKTIDFNVENPRLQSLSALKNPPPYLYFVPERGGNVEYKMNHSDSVSLHISNLLNRSHFGMYYANDNWVVPKITEVVDIPEIRDHLSLHPTQIVEDMKRGKMGQMFERAAITHSYGFKGTIGDMIDIFEEAVINTPIMYNDDGTQLTSDDMGRMITSAKVLRGKYQVAKGIKKNVESVSGIENFIRDVSPGLTRTIFGGNLALATYTVENLQNTFQQLLGMGNLTGALRSLFAPFTGGTLNAEQRKRVARDLVHLIESLTKGYIPDYETPSSTAEKHFIARVFDSTGAIAMIPAQHVLATTAISRCISLRNFVVTGFKDKDSKGRSRWRRLYESIQERPLNIDSDTDIKARVREAGFTDWFDNDTNIIIGMVSRGLFEDGAFSQFEAMIEKSLESGDPYYSTGDLFREIIRNSQPNSPDYQARKAVIIALKNFEKAYIEEVLLTPNPFDTATPMVDRNGNVTNWGIFDPVFEIFRRYPMLFVGMHMFRKSNTVHPMRYALGLTNLLMLDFAYMMALRLAMGAEIDDVLEEFEENPAEFSFRYFVRLPILGRYMGLLGEAAQFLTSDYGREPGGLIPVGALGAAVKGFKKAFGSQVSDDPAKWQDTINAMRVIPIIGDRLLSLAFYSAMGDNITKRSRGGVSHGGNSSIRGHYGISPQELEFTWNSLNNKLINSISRTEPLRWGEYEAMHSTSNFLPMGGTEYPPTAESDRMRKAAQREDRERKQKVDLQSRDDAQRRRENIAAGKTFDYGYPVEGDIDFESRIAQQKGTSSELVERLKDQ